MKSLIAFCVFLFAALAMARPGEEQYTDKYDNVDLDQILANKKLLDGYIKCILDQGKCTADGKELKVHIREALENKCSKCTETQKSGTRRVIKHLINHEPGYWKDLCVKYDPENKYATKYEEELRDVKA